MAKFYEPKKVKATVKHIVANPVRAITKHVVAPVIKPVRQAIKSTVHPIKSIKHLVHNPTSALLKTNLRQSSGFRNIARPIIKVGTGAAAGFVASAGNPLGAIAGGVTSAIGGGTTNNAFRPLPNLVAPAVVGGGFNPAVQSAISSALGPAAPVASGVTGTQGAVGTLGPLAGGSAITSATPLTTLPGASGIAGALAGPSAAGVAKSVALAAANGISLAPNIGSATGGSLLSKAGSFITSALGAGLSFAQKNPLATAAIATNLAAAFQKAGVDPAQLNSQAAANKLLSPTIVSDTLRQLQGDPNIQKQLDAMHRKIMEKVRQEYLSTYGVTLSQTGGFGGSQQAQIEQTMQADLLGRLQQNDQAFLLGLVGTQLNVNQNAVAKTFQGQAVPGTALSDLANGLNTTLSLTRR